MTKIISVAKKEGFLNVLDGKNVDDTKVYRPGNKATRELGIISPLEKAGFTKEDIRRCSQKLGIKFWNKPSNSCLATRFPYDTVLNEDDLSKVEKAEKILKKLGIEKVRVRVHGKIARIEVNESDFEKLINAIKYNKVNNTNNVDNTENMDNAKEKIEEDKVENIVEEIKKLGFRYVTLDLSGIRSGSFD